MKSYSPVINRSNSFSLLNWLADCIVIRLISFFPFYNEYLKHLNCLYLEICLTERIASTRTFISTEKSYTSIYYILVLVITLLVKYCIIMEAGWSTNYASDF